MVSMPTVVFIIILIVTIFITFVLTIKLLEYISEKPIYSIVEFSSLPESNLKRYVVSKYTPSSDTTYYKDLSPERNGWITPSERHSKYYLGTLDQCKAAITKSKKTTVMKLKSREYDLE